MTRRITLAAFLALAGIFGQCAAFWPRAVGAESGPPITLDFTFPAGTTYRTTPLVITGQTGATIKGQRSVAGVSRMVYRGPATKAAIQFIGCTRCQLLDLEVIDESGCDATVLLTNAVNPSMEGYSTGCTVRNVRVLLSGNGKASKRAFSVDSLAVGFDGNNDHHRFEDCYAQSYTESGFDINGGQCHDLYFLRCAAHDAGGRGGIGINARMGVCFKVERMAFNSNAIDVKLKGPEIQAVFDGVNSENSKQFLKADFAGECFTRITDVRWDGKPVAGRPVVEASGQGPWSITNSFFSGTNGVCPTMRFNGPSPGSLDVAGVMLRQHGGTTPAAALVTCPRGWSVREHAMLWQKIEESGGRSRKAFFINKPLP